MVDVAAEKSQFIVKLKKEIEEECAFLEETRDKLKRKIESYIWTLDMPEGLLR